MRLSTTELLELIPALDAAQKKEPTLEGGLLLERLWGAARFRGIEGKVTARGVDPPSPVGQPVDDAPPGRDA